MGKKKKGVPPPRRDPHDLASWHWIVVNTSGGKDSQAMVDVMVEWARAAGVADRLVFVHADLGRVEWEGTLTLARRQVAHYGPYRFYIVKRGANEKTGRPERDLLEEIEDRGKWPGPDTRYCTSYYKRDQVKKLHTELGREARRNGWVKKGEAVRILDCLGIRAEEGDGRSKRNPMTWDEEKSSGAKEVWEYYPIFDWCEDEVWARIRKAGTPHHPAYDAGMRRLSCVFCVFATPADLRTAASLNPDLAEEYMRVEDKIGHAFTSKTVKGRTVPVTLRSMIEDVVVEAKRNPRRLIPVAAA